MKIEKVEVKQTNYQITLTKEELALLTVIVGQTGATKPVAINDFPFKLYTEMQKLCYDELANARDKLEEAEAYSTMQFGPQRDKNIPF